MVNAFVMDYKNHKMKLNFCNFFFNFNIKFYFQLKQPYEYFYSFIMNIINEGTINILIIFINHYLLVLI